MIQFKTTNATLIIVLRQRKMKQNDTNYWSYYLDNGETNQISLLYKRAIYPK